MLIRGLVTFADARESKGKIYGNVCVEALPLSGFDAAKLPNVGDLIEVQVAVAYARDGRSYFRAGSWKVV